jgi:hypothetical protein
MSLLQVGFKKEIRMRLTLSVQARFKVAQPFTFNRSNMFRVMAEASCVQQAAM